MASTDGSTVNKIAPDLSPDTIPDVNKQYRLQFEKAQDSWVLLFPEGMVKLNQSAGEILHRCDGKSALSAIVQDLERTFEQSDLTSEVNDFLSYAAQQGWVRLA